MKSSPMKATCGARECGEEDVDLEELGPGGNHMEEAVRVLDPLQPWRI
jgi:hypothetical protein